jgi:hypothetical protein
MKTVAWILRHPIYATCWYATRHCYSSFLEWRNNGRAD